MSKALESVILAHKKGYRVDEHGTVIGPGGKPRKCTVSTWGFYRFNIYHEGGKVNVWAHKLAAWQVFGERLRSDLCITFKNRDRQDLRPENLKLATRSEIMMALPKLERMAHAHNAARKLRALTESQLKSFLSDRAAGASLRTLSRKYGIAKSTASYIASGKSYS